MKLLTSAVFLLLVFGCTSAGAQTSDPAAPAGTERGGLSPSRTLADQIIAQGDRNADRKLTAAEFTALADIWFDALDPDRAGRVQREEFLQRFDGILPAVGLQGAGRRGAHGPSIVGAANALGLFTAADQNHDAVLERTELKRAIDSWFTAWDSDRNGELTPSELLRGLNTILPRTNLGVTTGRESIDAVAGLPAPPPSPPLMPAESMATIRLPEGFKIELAASEPMIEDPVALTFDEDGRAYVVEMRSFMLDIDRAGEREPLGRITRLEDTDGDGCFDRATVFLDQLIVPRAVAAVAGGVLYVSDYQLYFARDTDGDGKADKIELIDADYGRGNVEHAANALFPAMDNWIYNGESPYRYRIVGGTVIRQTTEFRGQWGMTQDNYGRLIYNVNNSQLMGDFTPPNYFARNPHHPATAGLSLFVATDQRVFPIRMNTAINRGYAADVLDAAGRAYVFASSCGPVVYRGDNFPADFTGNAFVCDPALNLLKRNFVFDRDLTLSSKFAYDDREFLASTDERFRPSSLYNGPDGALWLVDMYRGIAQHGQFMTPYLRRETLARNLDKGIHYGRIYRITSTTKPPAAFPRLSRESSAALVGRLSSPNGWIRDTAQRLIVERGDRSVAPALAKLIAGTGDPLGRIHALWALEGLFAALPARVSAAPKGDSRLLVAEAGFALEAPALPPDILQTCLAAIADPNPKIQTAAIRVAEALTAGNAAGRQALRLAFDRVVGAAAEVVFQAALTAGNLAPPEALPLLARLLTREAAQLLIRDAVLSGLRDFELPFLEILLADPQWNEPQSGRAATLHALASALLKERVPAKIERLLALAADQRSAQAWRRRALLDGIAANTRGRLATPLALDREPAGFATLAGSDDAATREQAARIKPLFTWPGNEAETGPRRAEARALTAAESTLIAAGKDIFQQLCAACHGPAGQGVTPLAPPLANSEWVTGPASRLIRIALHGMGGPLSVGGTVFQPPLILPEMPPLATLDDAQLSAVLSFVRRAWGHEAAPISAAQIAAVRAETPERKTPWTAAQLAEIK